MTLSGAATAVDVPLARAACEISSCGAEPSACNEALSLFQRPFDGARAVSNLFDHEFPLSGQDPEPGFRSYCGGGNGRNGINGHDGIDWVMPEGTPLLAVADATVAVAGTERPFSCPLLGGREAARPGPSRPAASASREGQRLRLTERTRVSWRPLRRAQPARRSSAGLVPARAGLRVKGPPASPGRPPMIYRGW